MELLRPLPLSTHSFKQLKIDTQLREQQLQCQLQGWGLIPTAINAWANTGYSYSIWSSQTYWNTTTEGSESSVQPTQALLILLEAVEALPKSDNIHLYPKKSKVLILTSLKQLASPHIYHLPGRLMKPKPVATKYMMSDQRLLSGCVSRMKPLFVHSYQIL